LTAPKLLIAEDDEALGALLEEYLASSGYQVTLVQRGDDAITAIKSQHFDIVLTDIVMPGADGLHVLAESKGNPNKTLVVLMTAYSGIEDAIHAVEQGAYDFVSKPFQLPEIRVRLDNATRYQSLLRKWSALEHQENKEAFVPYIASESPIYASAAIKAYGVRKG
jgi:DNA-binding NtrC family response regulator